MHFGLQDLKTFLAHTKRKRTKSRAHWANLVHVCRICSCLGLKSTRNETSITFFCRDDYTIAQATNWMSREILEIYSREIHKAIGLNITSAADRERFACEVAGEISCNQTAKASETCFWCPFTLCHNNKQSASVTLYIKHLCPVNCFQASTHWKMWRNSLTGSQILARSLFRSCAEATRFVRYKPGTCTAIKESALSFNKNKPGWKKYMYFDSFRRLWGLLVTNDMAFWVWKPYEKPMNLQGWLQTGWKQLVFPAISPPS